MSKESPALTALRAARNASDHLRGGVTTVRDLGSTDGLSIELAQAIELGVVVGPRVVAAGRAITMTGGHVFCIGREADGQDGVRRAVLAELKAGAQCIKLMASGGVLGPPAERPGAPQLTVEEMRAGAEEAHRAGRPVAAHAHSLEAANNALEAGVDSIEHGSFLDQKTAERMCQAGVYLVPTLSAGRALHASGRELRVSDQVREKIATVVRASAEAFQLALRAGVPIAAGTDGGVPGQAHGALAEELIAMVEYGATPRQALHVATAAAASLLNVGDEVGSLEPGKRADIVAVSGNALRDIGALRHVQMVLLGGIEMRIADCSGEPLERCPR